MPSTDGIFATPLRSKTSCRRRRRRRARFKQHFALPPRNFKERRDLRTAATKIHYADHSRLIYMREILREKARASKRDDDMSCVREIKGLPIARLEEREYIYIYKRCEGWMISALSDCVAPRQKHQGSSRKLSRTPGYKWILPNIWHFSNSSARLSMKYFPPPWQHLSISLHSHPVRVYAPRIIKKRFVTARGSLNVNGEFFEKFAAVTFHRFLLSKISFEMRARCIAIWLHQSAWAQLPSSISAKVKLSQSHIFCILWDASRIKWCARESLYSQNCPKNFVPTSYEQRTKQRFIFL